MSLRLAKLNDNFLIAHGKVGYPKFRLDVFLYYVDGLLVDTGPRSLAKDAKPFFLAFPPKQVIVTHLHEDHCGLGFWINLVYPDVPIYVHPDRVDEASRKARLPLYRRIIWGRRDAFKAEPYPGDFIKTDRYSFQIIHVGGHSDDHIILYEPNEGWLFVGDLFLTTRPIVIFHEEKAFQTLAALRKMLSLDFSDLFCAHSGHHKNGRELIAMKKEYLESLQAKVKELKDRGYSVEEIDKILFPKKLFVSRISRGEWTSLNLIKTLDPQG
jgi:glyoxylase-like metal-dependent hydrolase (beta-lactamase superfamily II)